MSAGCHFNCHFEKAFAKRMENPQGIEFIYEFFFSKKEKIKKKNTHFRYIHLRFVQVIKLPPLDELNR